MGSLWNAQGIAASEDIGLLSDLLFWVSVSTYQSRCVPIWLISSHSVLWKFQSFASERFLLKPWDPHPHLVWVAESVQGHYYCGVSQDSTQNRYLRWWGMGSGWPTSESYYSLKRKAADSDFAPEWEDLKYLILESGCHKSLLLGKISTKQGPEFSTFFRWRANL